MDKITKAYAHDYRGIPLSEEALEQILKYYISARRRYIFNTVMKYLTLVVALNWVLLAFAILLLPDYHLIKANQILASLYVAGVFFYWYKEYAK